MHFMIRPTILTLACLLLLTVGQTERADAQEHSRWGLGSELIATLRIASDTEIAAARSSATDQLNIVQADLSKQAIGAVLRGEFQIERLATELQKLRPDPAVLRDIGQGLRRQLTGRMHDSVNELRNRVHQLAVLVSLTPDRVDDAVKAIERLTGELGKSKPIEQGVNELEFRRAFEVLAELHPSASAVKSLRTRLSVPNHRVQVKSEYVKAITRSNFDVPVNFRQNVNSTDITGNGQMHISVSVELPQSVGQSQLRILVSGNGQVGITATRDIAHIQASTAAQISGTQLISIKPDGITGAQPYLQSQFCTRLLGISLDGLLGNCNLARRIASRAAQNELAQNDVSAARQFEKTAQQRVEEEGLDAAYKINQLIERTFWDHLQGFDVIPDLHIRNDEKGIVSDATYARYDQLGAVTPVPRIPLEIDRRLDLITWVHESMLNNASDHFSGVRLDEATIRGLLEVELKLTNDEWTTMPAGRIPVGVTLAADNPVQFRFADQGIEILLRAVSCELDGTVQDAETREFRVRYQLIKDETGAHFLRQEATPTAALPAEKAVIWQEVLGRLFGKSIRPMPKFCNRESPQFMHVDYLELDGGWLILGAARTPDVSSVLTHVSSEKQP